MWVKEVIGLIGANGSSSIFSNVEHCSRRDTMQICWSTQRQSTLQQLIHHLLINPSSTLTQLNRIGYTCSQASIPPPFLRHEHTFSAQADPSEVPGELLGNVGLSTSGQTHQHYANGRLAHRGTMRGWGGEGVNE